MMKKFFLIISSLLFSVILMAQKPIDPERYKEYGFNMTGMIANFIPFNSTNFGIGYARANGIEYHINACSF